MPDVVVVGGGIAGMQAALAASQKGASVLLLTRTHPTRSHSATLQEGVNAAIDTADSPEQHAADTLESGAGLASPDLVRSVCSEAPALIERLDRMGAPFTREGPAPAVLQMAGSSRSRSLFADDFTGQVVNNVLYEQVLKAGFEVREDWVAVALAVEGSRCSGVVGIDIATGRLELFPAGAVVLATGAPRRLYEPSTASLACSGDGIGLAYRAGAQLVDMEMVEYHPHVVKDTHFPLTDLLTASVAQTNGAVDLTGHPDINSGRYFTTRHRLNGLLGLDPAKTPVPVQPAMHRLLGGIAVDANGATVVSGLYAAGGCAGSTFHGAAVLPGNGMLESLVIGQRAGGAAAAASGGARIPPSSLTDDVRRQLDGILSKPAGSALAGLRRQLGRVMDEQVGRQRNQVGLDQAAATIDQLRQQYGSLGPTSQQREYNHGLIHYLEFGHLLDVAGAVVTSASARKETRGAHVRSDFPERNDTDGAGHVVVTWDGSGPALETRPVAAGA